VTVNGAQGVEERGVVGKGGCGTISDGFDVSFGGGVVVFCVVGDDLVEDLVDCGGGGDELDGVGGTDVEERGGGLGDGVERRWPPEMWPTLIVGVDGGSSMAAIWVGPG